MTSGEATVMVKVSAANARQRFHGCTPDYIRTVCHGACCRSSTSPTGTLITIHPSEQAAMEAAAPSDHGQLPAIFQQASRASIHLTTSTS